MIFVSIFGFLCWSSSIIPTERRVQQCTSRCQHISGSVVFKGSRCQCILGSVVLKVWRCWASGKRLMVFKILTRSNSLPASSSSVLVWPSNPSDTWDHVVIDKTPATLGCWCQCWSVWCWGWAWRSVFLDKLVVYFVTKLEKVVVDGCWCWLV